MACVHGSFKSQPWGSPSLHVFTEDVWFPLSCFSCLHVCGSSLVAEGSHWLLEAAVSGEREGTAIQDRGAA